MYPYAALPDDVSICSKVIAMDQRFYAMII